MTILVIRRIILMGKTVTERTARAAMATAMAMEKVRGKALGLGSVLEKV